MILTETVNMMWDRNNKDWYESRGYTFTKFRDKFFVKTSELQNGSKKEVLIRCDYCGERYYRPYYCVIRNRKRHGIEKDSCKRCAKLKMIEIGKLASGVGNLQDHSMIENFINTQTDCILISEFKNTNSKLTLICRCGNKFSVNFIHFYYGNQRQCKDCGIKNRSGENHWNWHGGINTEANEARNSLEYKNWRISVFQRDKYSCQCCGSKKKIQAHHIENFSSHKDKRFDINNGITLCFDCHDTRSPGSFHCTYGTRNNTREQLLEYISKHRRLHQR